MFKNYLTVALRRLFRQRLYAFINIVGLALGTACCLLMALYVKYEWSYDRFQKNKDRIYRVLERHVKPNGRVALEGLHPLSSVEHMIDTLPGLERISGYIVMQDVPGNPSMNDLSQSLCLSHFHHFNEHHFLPSPSRGGAGGGVHV